MTLILVSWSGIFESSALRISWQYSTTSGPYASTGKGGAWLENEPLVTLDAGDALAVEILEQRYRIFAGKPCELLEPADIDQGAAQSGHLRCEPGERCAVNEQVVVSHSHDCLAALEDRDDSAHIGFFDIEPLRDVGPRGGSQTRLCEDSFHSSQGLRFGTRFMCRKARQGDHFAGNQNLLIADENIDQEFENLCSESGLTAQRGGSYRPSALQAVGDGIDACLEGFSA